MAISIVGLFVITGVVLLLVWLLGGFSSGKKCEKTSDCDAVDNDGNVLTCDTDKKKCVPISCNPTTPCTERTQYCSSGSCKSCACNYGQTNKPDESCPTCMGCTKSSDCADATGTTYCGPSKVCVQCTENSHCGDTGDTCTSNVCKCGKNAACFGDDTCNNGMCVATPGSLWY